MVASGSLAEVDPQIAAAIDGERRRSATRLDLSASANHTSAAQREAAGSVLGDATVEGYPGHRFLAASADVDRVERLAVERATALFGARYANVQPHSGTQANQAVLVGLLEPGDTLLSMALHAGGHFSHGAPVSVSGRWFRAVHYGVDPRTDRVDLEAVAALAQAHRPRLIVAGASAYPRAVDTARLARIARGVGARLMVDIAHVAGLVATGTFPDPLPDADVVTTTTSKNLRGPHGGLVLCNDPEIASRIDQALSPGLQGTPLVQAIAAKAVAFREAATPAFRRYAERVLGNARALARGLAERGVDVLTGGTDVPFVVADLRRRTTDAAAVVRLLDGAGITAHAVPAPGDRDFAHARGLRLGLSAATTRGFDESACDELAAIGATAVLRAEVGQSSSADIAAQVAALCRRFPLAPSAGA